MSTKEDLLLAEIADLREQLYRAENPTFNGRLDSWQAACGKARGESELLRNELRELKAENAGLRTGYQAYERVNAELKAEVEGLGNGLAETELRALKYIHQFAAASDLGRDMRVALEAIVALGGSGPEFQIAHDALEPFRTHAAAKSSYDAAMGKGEQS